MKRRIVTTADGSKTIQVEDWKEHYHSTHGAIQESLHVFIKNGLHFCCSQQVSKHKPISILEIGFGTGLNAFLTRIEADRKDLNILYDGVEAYPVEWNVVRKLNYTDFVSNAYTEAFKNLHISPWHIPTELSKKFTLEKHKIKFQDLNWHNRYDLIYYDAFGYRVQPELWTEGMFKLMFNALKDQGILVTYCAKGSVRRAMQAVGFEVERLQGPPGKREMLRALKTGF